MPNNSNLVNDCKFLQLLIKTTIRTKYFLIISLKKHKTNIFKYKYANQNWLTYHTYMELNLMNVK